MTSPLTQAQLDQLRAALLAERDGLEQDRENRMEDVRDFVANADEHGDYGQHTADDGTDTFEQTKNLSLANALQSHIDQINRALERMDAGTYGTCEECGQPIPFERLEAMPSTPFCIDHANAQGRIA